MNRFYLTLPAMFLLSACATSTPIAQLGFPSPTVLTGTIESIEEDSFVLKDATGSIEVETEDAAFVEENLAVGDTVTVKGVLDEDDSQGKDRVVAKEFDAYAVILPSGEEIILVPYQSK